MRGIIILPNKVIKSGPLKLPSATFANFMYNSGKANPMKRYKYHKIDVNKISDILSIKWTEELQDMSADDAYNRFLDKYNNACTPGVYIFHSDPYLPPSPLSIDP